MSSKDVDVSAVNARLLEAAERDQTVEVILVVRGKIRPVRGGDGRRWRMRIDRQHVLTFRSDAVVAATPMPARSGDDERRAVHARAASTCPPNERR